MFIGTPKRPNLALARRGGLATHGAAKQSSARLRTLLDVLLVEDDRELAEMLSLSLGDHGARVRVVHTIRDARIAIAAQAPGVLVSDYHLPDGTGWELAHDLRVSGATAVMGLVVMSGSEVPPEHRAWFDGFLEKPVDAEQLYEVVRQLQLVVRERASAPPEEPTTD
jgi:DNA-binding response OmpR family regulator